MGGRRANKPQPSWERETPPFRTSYTVAGARFDPGRFLRAHPTARPRRTWRHRRAYLVLGEKSDRKTSGIELVVSEARDEHVHLAEIASFVTSEAALIAAAPAPGLVHYLETEVQADPIGPRWLVLPPALAADLGRLGLPWVLVVDIPGELFDDAPPEMENDDW
jgi:hypothetical protein